MYSYVHAMRLKFVYDASVVNTIVELSSTTSDNGISLSFFSDEYYTSTKTFATLY